MDVIGMRELAREVRQLAHHLSAYADFRGHVTRLEDIAARLEQAAGALSAPVETSDPALPDVP